MKRGIIRSIIRWIHLLLSIPVGGYIYGNPANVAQYAGGVRWLFFPAIVVSGLLMWKGQWLGKLIPK